MIGPEDTEDFLSDDYSADDFEDGLGASPEPEETEPLEQPLAGPPRASTVEAGGPGRRVGRARQIRLRPMPPAMAARFPGVVSIIITYGNGRQRLYARREG